MERVRLEIPIAGIPEEVEIRNIDIDCLVLDEENPRIGYWLDNVAMSSDSTPQGQIELALKAMGDDYVRLKRSIESSEGVLQEIWVYPVPDGKYKVVDGNTRVLIYRELRDKYPHKEVFQDHKVKGPSR